jgi:hypothetical protein
MAIALAAAPDAVAAREELARSLLDLVALGTADRLRAGRDLLARAADLARIGGAPGESPAPSSGGVAPPDDPEAEADVRPARGTPAERRQAAAALLSTWTAVARDLVVTAAGAGAAARDTALFDDLRAVGGVVAPDAWAAFLGRLVRAAELLEANANPELLVDTLVLAWPHARAADAAR